MNFYDNHRLLFGSALGLFIILTGFVAISPALNNQRNNAPLPSSRDLLPDELAGKRLYVANGCVACHTQQVRNIAMDKPWGQRPSIAADYARIGRMDTWRNTATLMGSERTGPDLTDIGRRQPSVEWHLLHLYNPRAVVKDSIMPAYPWLFETKPAAEHGDKVVGVPDDYKRGQGDVVAKPEALQLVSYLLSLKQPELPTGTEPSPFLYDSVKAIETSSGDSASATVAELDGGAIYAASCQACHQANGEGLKGAFPPLKGSPIVLNENSEQIVDIIMKGFDGRVSEGFAVMPPIGTINNFDAAEIQAVVNYVRRSWGNDAPKTTLDDVQAHLNKSNL